MKLIFPCDYIGITQGYKSSHKAIDMGWSTGNGGPNHKILAPYDGVVTYVKIMLELEIHQVRHMVIILK